MRKKLTFGKAKKNINIELVLDPAVEVVIAGETTGTRVDYFDGATFRKIGKSRAVIIGPNNFCDIAFVPANAKVLAQTDKVFEAIYQQATTTA